MTRFLIFAGLTMAASAGAVLVLNEKTFADVFSSSYSVENKHGFSVAMAGAVTPLLVSEESVSSQIREAAQSAAPEPVAAPFAAVSEAPAPRSAAPQSSALRAGGSASPSGGTSAPTASLPAAPPESSAASAATPAPAPAPAPSFSLTPTIGMRGGGGGGVTNPPQPGTQTESGGPAADTTAPSAPVVSSPASGGAATSTAVAFSGTAEAGATLSTSFSTTTAAISGSGAWSLSLTLPQGTSTILFYATDSSGNVSAGTSHALFVDSLAPDAPVIASPASGVTATSTAVSFSGTAEANATLSTDFSSATAAVSTAGVWSLSLTLPQGTSTILFYATDAASWRSAAATGTVFVDSIAPSVSLSVDGCSDSPASGSCLLLSTALSFSWTSTSTDVAYYMLDRNGSVSTTTALSGSATADDRSAYTVRVSATDQAGNRSATSTQALTVHTTPVVVSEIAWAGTAASGADEWLELYNNTSLSLSLANFTLYAADLVPYVPLIGTVSPSSYFLIERKNTGETTESTQSSVIGETADLWTSFGEGLDDNGETLALAWKPSSSATTTIETIATCSGGTTWCKGSASTFATMERYDALMPGGSSSNWLSHLGQFIQNGTDTNGTTLKATPKRRNSASYLVASSSDRTLASDKTLTSTSSPYLVDTLGLAVGSGVTLTIDPGVVIKVVSASTPSVTIDGALTANGTASSPVVFTSFYDDTYGGDLNADGSATAPAAGDWARLYITSGSASATLSNTYVRYAGNLNTFGSDPKGALSVNAATTTLTNIAVEHSGYHGLALKNSGSTVSNSRFSTSTVSSVTAVGMHISGGSPSVSGSTFSGNYRGMTIQNATPSLSNNVFTGNTKEAVFVSGVLGSFSGNSGSGNEQNAIVFGNDTSVTASGATTTLAANSLPYLVKKTATVVDGSTLHFESGVVVKGHDSRSSNTGLIDVQGGGKISSYGTATSSLVFTSIRDGTVGGTTESGLGSAAAGDWYGITVQANGILRLSGFTMKYGGYGAQAVVPSQAAQEGAIKITGGTVSSGDIANALFDANYQSGLVLKNVLSFIASNSLFQNHTDKQTGSATGLYVKDSTATFSSLTWSGNEKDAVGSGTNTVSCTSCGSPNTTPSDLFTP